VEVYAYSRPVADSFDLGCGCWDAVLGDPSGSNDVGVGGWQRLRCTRREETVAVVVDFRMQGYDMVHVALDDADDVAVATEVFAAEEVVVLEDQHFHELGKDFALDIDALEWVPSIPKILFQLDTSRGLVRFAAQALARRN
jgi:hypothetical protein